MVFRLALLLRLMDGLLRAGLIWCPVAAEQKVKVPSAHCDSRVRTVCANVMALMKQQARAMSPQVRCSALVYLLLVFGWMWIFLILL
jgi:hypothetical protein